MPKRYLEHVDDDFKKHLIGLGPYRFVSHIPGVELVLEAYEGYCLPAGVIVPLVMEYALQAEPFPYDPGKAQQLLAEAGYPHGFEAGELVPLPPFFTVAEVVVNDLKAVGIRVRLGPMARAPFYAAWREKKLRGLFMTRAGASGNAATRVVVSKSCGCAKNLGPQAPLCAIPDAYLFRCYGNPYNE